MNQLKTAKSAYLQDHADNPVHWHVWSDETLEKARAENKPILLSGGYSACHWCHVMAHESFEDTETAELMNEHFINIKLDREERPDLDHMYQQALSLMGEPGGWPLTMFLTPKGEPFFGGTYFPPEPKFGRPAFKQILQGIADSWQNEQETVQYNVEAMMGALRQESEAKSGAMPEEYDFKDAAQKLISGFDPKHGGFGSAPKFPQVPLLSFMLKYAEKSDDDIYRKASLITLDNLCQGGIYDHLNGGFFRYATDERWLVPHFEKMLYDNALLIRHLTAAHRMNPSRLYKGRVFETVKWLFDDMTLDDGICFAASQDADTDGVEGGFYIWNKSDIDTALGIDAHDFDTVYDVTDAGNWQGKVILNRLKHQGMFNEKKEARLDEMKQTLKTLRDKRTKPARDSKRLTDWNAMTAVALIEAGKYFEQTDWVQRGQAVFKALKDHIVHCRIDGEDTAPAMLEDYAWMILLAIKCDDMQTAQELYKTAQANFHDAEGGGFFMGADHNAPLRIKTVNDSAMPAGNAVMVEALSHLSPEQAADLIKCFAGEIKIAPYAMGGFLAAAFDFYHNTP